MSPIPSWSPYLVNISIEGRILLIIKKLLFKTNLHVNFLPNVVVCCCILYNMILVKRASYIDDVSSY
jgi:hypothetical protein